MQAKTITHSSGEKKETSFRNKKDTSRITERCY